MHASEIEKRTKGNHPRAQTWNAGLYFIFDTCLFRLSNSYLLDHRAASSSTFLPVFAIAAIHRVLGDEIRSIDSSVWQIRKYYQQYHLSKIKLIMREGTVLEFQIVINVITWPYRKDPLMYYDLTTILRTRCKCSLNRPDPNFKTYFVCTFPSGSQINSFKAMTEVKRSCFYPRSIVSTFSRLEIGAICPTRVTDMEYLWYTLPYSNFA